MMNTPIELPSKNRRLAFTLIELLTVIAVIAVLAGILIPAVGKVRETARAATSASNLRELGQGLNLFVADGSSIQASMVGKRRYPAAWGTYGAPYWCNFGWQQLVADQLGYMKLEPGGYQWIVTPHDTVFQDPSYDVKYDPDNSGSTASYAINFHLVAGYSKNKPHPNGKYLENREDLPPVVLKVENPSQCVALGESNRDGASDTWLWPSSGWAAAGAPSHYKNGGHYYFVDGHVEWMAAADVTDNMHYFFLNGQR